MISILIPVYNFDVRELVATLHEQGLHCGIDFEILCFDDHSLPEYQRLNASVHDFSRVIFKVLPENVGRSRIRNIMVEEARFEYLLFIDCDSGAPGGGYLRKYLGEIENGRLLYGGRVYGDRPPADPGLIFHWHYGRSREQVLPEKRQREPYHAFMTNNFLIPAKIFRSIRFEELVYGYGHEDTLFGLKLKQLEIPVVHIDNPLEHLGLEQTDRFLAKTKEAVKNLAYLAGKFPEIETKLLTAYKTLARFGVAGLTGKALEVLEPVFLRNFHSLRPNLFFFDLYRLKLLLEEIKMVKNNGVV